jgi:P4 family phage/plasmid primase-like protien
MDIVYPNMSDGECLIPVVKPKTTTKMTASNAKAKKISYFDFMKSHLLNKESGVAPSNTRIGDKNYNIFGGSYYFKDDEYKTFLDQYYEEVFVKHKPEYLTEKQLEEEGPILIDLDLRFDLEVSERKYTREHLEDLKNAYLGELKKIFQFDEDLPFPMYIFEKSSVNRIPEKKITKDGIHIIIGIKTDHITQQVLRKRMIPVLANVWKNLPIVNEWKDVLDEGISIGHTNWQMYGSKKPNNEPYQLTQVLEIEFDASDEEFKIKQINIEKFNLKENFHKLSARYREHPTYFFKSGFIHERESAIEEGEVVCAQAEQVKKIKRSTSSEQNLLQNSIGNNLNQIILSIRNKDELDQLVNQFLDTLSPLEYEIRESYDYTMTLPNKYYGDGTYTNWIRVGWALRNISDRLFIIWIAFSAQSPKFNFYDIPQLYERWYKFNMNDPNGLTKRSIMHWSKIDAYDKYKQVRSRSIDYHIDQTYGIYDADLNKKKSSKTGHSKIANVLFQLYKDEFVCVSIQSKGGVWYMYDKHKWELDEAGTTLRKRISSELQSLFIDKAMKIMDFLKIEQNEETAKMLNFKMERLLEIAEKLDQTPEKNNIMTEARELFYDKHFEEKLDTDPCLLCFRNGIVDFRKKEFRRGYPEDCVSKTTKIDYRPVDPVKDREIVEEIRDFMRKLFPVKELHDYMWQHLASTLIGTCPNQTFNMYIGVGQNGKSVLVSLMEMVLGEYKGDVPLTLVTGARTKIGGLAPELVSLKGVRYAVMQEPSKGDVINEGIMKQITSGVDPIQARGLFSPQPITYVPQFKLVVCSNEFMEIKSSDHGTWRRIRVVDFMSLFVDKPVMGDKEKPYQYLLDKNIKDKFNRWKEVFAAMLVEIAFETQGNVQDCEIVLKSSNSYRESQDYIAEYIADRILPDQGGVVQKTELNNDFKLWFEGNHGGKKNSLRDVHNAMDKKFGKFSQYKCWRGCRINYENTVATMDIEDTYEIGVGDEYANIDLSAL